MRRSVIEAMVGGALVLGFGALLPLVLRPAAKIPDLQVRLRSATAHAIMPMDDPHFAISPKALIPRLEPHAGGDAENLPSGPGIELADWKVKYGQRWEREVTVPILHGPFDAEGTAWPCALGLRLRPAFFDDGAPGGSDVEAILEQHVRQLFPRDMRVAPAVTLKFPAVRENRVHLRLVEGAIVGQFDISLVDGTTFRGRIRIALSENPDAPGELTASHRLDGFEWSGRTRGDWRLGVVDFFSGPQRVNAAARDRVDQQIAEVIGGGLAKAMARLHTRIRLFADRPDDRFQLRLCGKPVLAPDGVTLWFGVSVKLGGQALDPRVPGPTHREGDLRFPPDDPKRPGAPHAGRPPTVEAIATPALLNQALYVLWRSGRLSRWGHQPNIVAAVRRATGDRLTFTIEGIDPRLPPTIGPDPGAADLGWHVRLADLLLGRDDAGRSVIGNGEAIVHPAIVHGAVELVARYTDVRLDCVSVETGPDQSVVQGFRPCYSDAIDMIRGGGELDQPYNWPLDVALLDRLLRVPLDGQHDLVLSDLTAEKAGTPPVLHLGARAQLVERKQATAQ